ncbi:MAG: hypothetical protein ACK5MK_00505, partial [Dysgonomonas sp.]
MRKITFVLTSFFMTMSISTAVFAQTYEVGAGKTYANITAAWTVISNNTTDTEFTINVDAGTYVESELTGVGMAGKKITIIGTGADVTTVMRADVSDFPLIETYGTGVTDGRLDCGILFASKKANLATGFHLVCEKITFKNIGTNRNNWSSALVLADGENQTYE